MKGLSGYVQYVVFTKTQLLPEMKSQGLQMPACRGMHCRKEAAHRMCAPSCKTVRVLPSLSAPQYQTGTSTFRHKDVVTDTFIES